MCFFFFEKISSVFVLGGVREGEGELFYGFSFDFLFFLGGFSFVFLIFDIFPRFFSFISLHFSSFVLFFQAEDGRSRHQSFRVCKVNLTTPKGRNKPTRGSTHIENGNLLTSTLHGLGVFFTL